MGWARGTLALAVCFAVYAGEAVAAPPRLQTPRIRAEHVVLAASEFGRGVPVAAGPCKDSKSHRPVPCPHIVPAAPGSKATIIGEALLAADVLSPIRLLWVTFETAAGADCLEQIPNGGVFGNATSLSCSAGQRLPCERGLCIVLNPQSSSSPAFVTGLVPARRNMTLRVDFANGATASGRLGGPLAHGVVGERMFLVLTGKQRPRSVTVLEDGRVMVSEIPFG